MNGKTILTIATPVTQSREAVQSLIAYQNHGTVPAEMPPFYRLSADMVLVASNKGDAYYVTTPKSCTCLAAAITPARRASTRGSTSLRKRKSPQQRRAGWHGHQIRQAASGRRSIYLGLPRDPPRRSDRGIDQNAIG